MAAHLIHQLCYEATLTTDANQMSFYCLVFKYTVLHYLGMHRRPLFSKILVAIDGSKPSIDAAKSAISLAKSYNAKLMDYKSPPLTFK
jgi:hypothetical protein